MTWHAGPKTSLPEIAQEQARKSMCTVQQLRWEYIGRDLSSPFYLLPHTQRTDFKRAFMHLDICTSESWVNNDDSRCRRITSPSVASTYISVYARAICDATNTEATHSTYVHTTLCTFYRIGIILDYEADQAFASVGHRTSALAMTIYRFDDQGKRPIWRVEIGRWFPQKKKTHNSSNIA